MSGLDDLLRRLEDLAEQQRQQQAPAPVAPQPVLQQRQRPVLTVKRQKARPVQQPPVQPKANHPHPAPPVAVAVPAPEAGAPGTSAGIKVAPLNSLDQQRICRLIHSPNAVREAFILKELLDRPLALRPYGRFGRR